MFGWFKRKRIRDRERAPLLPPDQVVYYDPSSTERQHSSFRGGCARWVRPGAEVLTDANFAELVIPPPVYQAFLAGPQNGLFRLPHEGMMGDYEVCILPPASLADASRILREAADAVGPEEEDVICAYRATPGNIDYRMKLPPEVVRKGFRDLADFIDGAKKKGYAAQLWL